MLELPDEIIMTIFKETNSYESISNMLFINNKLNSIQKKTLNEKLHEITEEQISGIKEDNTIKYPSFLPFLWKKLDVEVKETLKDILVKKIKNPISGKDRKIIGECLQNADLEDTELRWAKLTKTNLKNILLKGTNLTNADLKGANLTKADLKGANLTNADLKGANLTNADLKGADLTNAELDGTNFKGVDLKGIDLKSVDLSKAINVDNQVTINPKITKTPNLLKMK